MVGRRARVFAGKGSVVNVTRGLFRLWIVLSTVWVVGIGALIWKDVFPSFQKLKIAGDHFGVVHVCARIERTNEQVLAWISNFDVAQLKSLPEGFCLDYDKKPSINERFTKASFAFAPPFALLLLGIVLAWVARGFRAV